MDYLYIIFGVIAGVFGGMGMGGGTVLIPLLTVFLAVEQKAAQGLNILSFLIMAIFALIIHKKNGLVAEKGVLPIIFSGLAFAAAGAFFAGMIPSVVLKSMFGGFMILLAVWEIVKIFTVGKTTNSKG